MFFTLCSCECETVCGIRVVVSFCYGVLFRCVFVVWCVDVVVCLCGVVCVGVYVCECMFVC